MATRSKALAGALTDDDILVAGVDLRAAPENPGGLVLIRGTRDDDALVGTEADEYLFGNRGDDTIAGGAGLDIVSGGAGADLMDTEGGLGVHIGGRGGDTYRIGDDILVNDTQDTIIAYGFDPDQGDTLQFDEGLAGVIRAVLDGDDTTSLTVTEGADLSEIAEALEDVNIKGDRDIKAFQRFLDRDSDEEGVVADATTVDLQNGDRIVVTGVDAETLLAVLDASVPVPEQPPVG